jgi:SAM-dependent methyltransferase
MIQENRYVTLEETASMLAVSSATVRNWIRHEYLRPARRSSGILFRDRDVCALRDKIISGSIPRLARRANKATARRSFIPDEYLGGGAGRDVIEEAVTYIARSGIGIAQAMFLLALGRLYDAGICGVQDAVEFIAGGCSVSGRENLGRELRSWHADLGNFSLTDKYAPLLDFDLPSRRDVLGLVYQSLLREGEKAAGGSYYTPGRIVDDIAASACVDGRVLDPCCGTGQFLLAFAEKAGDPHMLVGCDIDGLAVRIARINLMLAFPDVDFGPRIYRGDFLHDGLPGDEVRDGFGVIATNPPWGLHYTSAELDRLAALYPGISSFESFSYMLKKSIDITRSGGSISFILPESILNVKTHRDIRSYILERARIRRIIRLERVFTNVFTPVIRLDLEKGAGPGRFDYFSAGKVRTVDQGRFRKNKGFVFDISIAAPDAGVIEKVYGHDHRTLEGGADWALGIVTGDNDRFLLSRLQGGGCEPIYRGRDISNYFLGEPACFIRFSPGRFQQSAPEHKYRAREKLIYRFISKYLVVAYDDCGCLTLNSANILIPRMNDYPPKAVLALFNSCLYQFLFQKKFSSIKVLRGHLEQLPLPLWSGPVMDCLVTLADGVLSGRASREDVDEFVMKQFGLTGAERTHIINSII